MIDKLIKAITLILKKLNNQKMYDFWQEKQELRRYKLWAKLNLTNLDSMNLSTALRREK